MSVRDGIALLVSDVDGTLVTDDKQLTDANVEASQRLARAGVKLSLVSSRPPIGFATLSDALGLRAPIGAFNGGMILNPDLSVIEATFVPGEAARRAVAAFAEFGIDAWLMTAETWYVLDADGDYVPKERQTIKRDPEVVGSFDDMFGKVGKLVGSSKQFDRVAACEAALRDRLGSAADVKRSQQYYLDVTPGGFDKGVAVKRIAAALGVPLSQVAVIGDMGNDLPMFAVAQHRIAMGNGIDELKRQASFVTLSNEEDGFAFAVDRYVLPHAAETMT